MIEKLLMKLRARDEMSAEEEQALRSLPAETQDVRPAQVVVRAGEDLSVSVLLLEGLMCRYKDLRSGARQISELHVPGDFVDLHGFTLKRLDHNIGALTAARIALVPHERLKRITEDHPHLTRLLWLSTNLDASIHREWVLSLGRRSALARIAHFFCELQVRLDLIGMTDGAQYRLPLTQSDLAECLGLTSVHVNRTLKELREQGIVEFRDATVTIHDIDRLRRVAEFDVRYLDLEKRPR